MADVRIILVDRNVTAVHVDGVALTRWTVEAYRTEYVSTCRDCELEITMSADEYSSRGADGDWDGVEMGTYCESVSPYHRAGDVISTREISATVSVVDLAART